MFQEIDIDDMKHRSDFVFKKREEVESIRDFTKLSFFHVSLGISNKFLQWYMKSC